MSVDVDEPSRDENGEEPCVPEEVLEAIDDLAEGNTATKADIEAVLKF
ncbi:hypothetical protein [Natronomonas sp. EA1]